MLKKIVFIGGPSTGKTTVIKEFEKQGYTCMNEISREITQQAQEQGVEQLFIEEPILFSEKILEGRINQFNQIKNNCTDGLVFFDRGIPSVEAYLKYFGSDYGSKFTESSKLYRYDTVFHFPTWSSIYTQDNERYESLEEAIKIDSFLKETYKDLKYNIVTVPFNTVECRCEFILENL